MGREILKGTVKAATQWDGHPKVKFLGSPGFQPYDWLLVQLCKMTELASTF